MMNRSFAPQQVDEIWISLKEQIKNDLEQKRRDLKEIALMIDQSQIEMKKLTQRNANK